MTDIQNLQREVGRIAEIVGYLRGVIDGPPDSPHINSVINGLDNRLEKLESRINVLEGVEDFHANPKIDSIGAQVEWSSVHEQEFFYQMYCNMTERMGLTPLTMDELLATPLSDWPQKLTDLQDLKDKTSN